jgi:hypothetical protein
MHPIPVACFCNNSSWWNRCIEGTDSSSKMCKEIDSAINFINNDLTDISKGLTSVFNTLSIDIPNIPTNIPKLADLVSSKYTNYTIDSIPKIPNVSMSCSVTIPMSDITNVTNKTTSQITGQLNNLTNKINSSPFFTGINDIVKQLNNIKNNIDSINVGKKLNINNLRLDCESGYTLNGLVCVPNPPSGYRINDLDIINYWLTESTSYPMGLAREAEQNNSACNNLDEPKSYGIGTCTGWKGDLNCKSTGCGCIHPSARYCNTYARKREIKIRECSKSCPSGWTNNKDLDCGVVGSCYRYVNGDCESYSCKDGFTRAGTGTAVTCWEDVITKCDGGFATRDAPRTCPSGTEFDDGKLLCYPKCRDGYYKNPADVVSCWNNKPTTIPITGTKAPKLTFTS